MLKKTFTYRRFIAMSLAFLMFFTASGMSLDVHFCKGHIAALSLFGPAPSCHDQVAKQKATSCCAKKIKLEPVKHCNKGCCDDASFLLKMDSDLIPAHFAKADKDIEWGIRSSFAFIKRAKKSFQSLSYQKYIPPLLDYDIPVLVQSFLL